MTYHQPLPLTLGAHTDAAGRPANEDTCLVRFLPDQNGQHNQSALLIVADGMGGGHSGRTASQLALSTVEEQYLEAAPSTPPLLALQQAVNRANSAVYAYSSTAGKAGNVGTTIVAAVIHRHYASIVSIGDSPAYLVRNQHANRITRDHNWANQQIDTGSLTSEQAYAHENARLLTHIVGRSVQFPLAETGQPDHHFSYLVELQPGDAIVLCSDGISEVLPPGELATLAISAPPQDAAQALVARARARATSDNATATVVQYGRQAIAAKRTAHWLPFAIGGGIVVAGIILLLVLFAFGSASQFASGTLPISQSPVMGSSTGIPDVLAPSVSPTSQPVQKPDMPEPATNMHPTPLPTAAEPTSTLAPLKWQTATMMKIETQAATQTARATTSTSSTDQPGPFEKTMPYLIGLPKDKALVSLKVLGIPHNQVTIIEWDRTSLDKRFDRYTPEEVIETDPHPDTSLSGITTATLYIRAAQDPPLPTSTLAPTATPSPTATPVPPTTTPVPPTATPVPLPTDTPVPPTNTPVPSPPTDTPMPPTATSTSVPSPPTDTSVPPTDEAPLPTPTPTPQPLVSNT